MENIVIKNIRTMFIRPEWYILNVTEILQIKSKIELKKKASNYWPFLGINENYFILIVFKSIAAVLVTLYLSEAKGTNPISAK
mgnify:CR=1 FL=1